MHSLAAYENDHCSTVEQGCRGTGHALSAPCPTVFLGNQEGLIPFEPYLKAKRPPALVGGRLVNSLLGNLQYFHSYPAHLV